MTYYFHPLAEQELDKAVRYYEECCSGLGLEFAEEVYATITRCLSPSGCSEKGWENGIMSPDYSRKKR